VGKKGRILLPSKKGLFRLSNESCKLWFLQATPTTDLRRVVGQLIPQYVANQGVGNRTHAIVISFTRESGNESMSVVRWVMGCNRTGHRTNCGPVQ
jgi:hypothetical protein